MSMRPVHTCGIPSRQEFWAHSDGDGVFDIIHYGIDHGKLYHEDIIAHDIIPGHGKLLWDDDLMPYAYASNTREGVVYEYDLRLSPPSIVRYIRLHENVTGTHGLAYSRVNRHIYATCSVKNGSPHMGDVEIDAETRSIITYHTDVRGGQLWETPDEKFVDIDKSGNAIHIITPGVTGMSSSQDYPSVTSTSNMPGNPDKMTSLLLPGGGWGVFFSLTTPLAPSSASGMWYVDTDK